VAIYDHWLNMANFVDASFFPPPGCNTIFFEYVQLDKIDKTAGCNLARILIMLWE
jgi:hypothetical protein